MLVVKTRTSKPPRCSARLSTPKSVAAHLRKEGGREETPFDSVNAGKPRPCVPDLNKVSRLAVTAVWLYTRHGLRREA